MHYPAGRILRGNESVWKGPGEPVAPLVAARSESGEPGVAACFGSCNFLSFVYRGSYAFTALEWSGALCTVSSPDDNRARRRAALAFECCEGRMAWEDIELPVTGDPH